MGVFSFPYHPKILPTAVQHTGYDFILERTRSTTFILQESTWLLLFTLKMVNSYHLQPFKKLFFLERRKSSLALARRVGQLEKLIGNNSILKYKKMKQEVDQYYKYREENSKTDGQTDTKTRHNYYTK